MLYRLMLGQWCGNRWGRDPPRAGWRALPSSANLHTGIFQKLKKMALEVPKQKDLSQKTGPFLKLLVIK